MRSQARDRVARATGLSSLRVLALGAGLMTVLVVAGPAMGADDDLLSSGGGDALLTEGGGDALLTEGGGDALLDEGGGDALLGDSGGDALLNENAGGDLLLQGGDPLSAGGDPLAADAAGPAEEEAAAEEDAGGSEAHAALFLENRFPSATTCAICHPRHFEEWAVSQHAYAQLSPVFNAMQATILKVTNGTNGDFCIRCHSPVGMNLGEPVFMSNLDRHPTSREGITCITCHRINQNYGKISGRLPIIEGDVTKAVYGPKGNENLEKALNNPDIRVTADPEARGRKIHGKAEKLSYLSTSAFCGSCHDVTLVNGFRLEEAFSEFKSSPAAAKGQTCQDCHMSTEPGIPSGYAFGPAAVVGGVETEPRKLTNHMFAGPDHSIIHPGLFPLNEDAQRMATMAEWLQFDYEAGWGTDEFENTVSLDQEFPERWSSIDDRYDARIVINEQLERLDMIAGERKKILQAGYKLDDVEVLQDGGDGLRFRVKVSNGTDGHNVPTGFTAERLVWLEVTVTDSNGEAVFKSGDLDPNGDVRDLHSLYVHNGEIPLDKQLFSLQSKFITRNVRGGEREQVLALNYSPDPLPFLRPDTTPTVLRGRTLGARIHKKGIEPLGHRWAEYEVDGDMLTGNPPYKAEIRLKAGMVPVNLISEILPAGFDYGMSPRDVAEGVVAGHQILWEKELVFDAVN